MRFTNRVAELATLKEWVREPVPGLLRLYGRRRLGKTELLHRLCEEEGGLYFLIDEADSPTVLSSLARQVSEQTDLVRPVLREWDDWYETLARLDAPFIVLDEFQRLLADQPVAVTRLQHHWDTHMKDQGPSVVLCGSSIGMMQRLTDSAQGPLFGRLSLDMRLRPFRYADVRLLYPGLDEADIVRRYAVFGGTPHYHRHSVGQTMEAAVRRSWLQEGAPFVDEPQSLLQWELRAPTRYNSIMDAIGKGVHDTKTIQDRVGVAHGGIAPYLKVLKDDLDILRLDEPVCGTKKRARYVFTDPFFTFYYRFVYDARARLELGRVDAVWQTIVDGLEAHVGRVFEDVAREVLMRLNGTTYDGVALDFDRIGRWWNRTGDEIDLVAEGPHEVLAGEVKWGGGPAGPGVLETLLDRIPRMERTGKKPVRPVLVVRDGLTPDGLERAREEKAIVIDLDRVRKIMEGGS